jgi:hypothetical protein
MVFMRIIGLGVGWFASCDWLHFVSTSGELKQRGIRFLKLGLVVGSEFR